MNIYMIICFKLKCGIAQAAAMFVVCTLVAAAAFSETTVFFSPKQAVKGCIIVNENCLDGGTTSEVSADYLQECLLQQAGTGVAMYNLNSLRCTTYPDWVMDKVTERTQPYSSYYHGMVGMNMNSLNTLKPSDLSNNHGEPGQISLPQFQFRNKNTNEIKLCNATGTHNIHAGHDYTTGKTYSTYIEDNINGAAIMCSEAQFVPHENAVLNGITRTTNLQYEISFTQTNFLLAAFVNDVIRYSTYRIYVPRSIQDDYFDTYCQLYCAAMTQTNLVVDTGVQSTLSSIYPPCMGVSIDRENNICYIHGMFNPQTSRLVSEWENSRNMCELHNSDCDKFFTLCQDTSGISDYTYSYKLSVAYSDNPNNYFKESSGCDSVPSEGELIDAYNDVMAPIAINTECKSPLARLPSQSLFEDTCKYDCTNNFTAWQPVQRYVDDAKQCLGCPTLGTLSYCGEFTHLLQFDPTHQNDYTSRGISFLNLHNGDVYCKQVCAKCIQAESQYAVIENGYLTGCRWRDECGPGLQQAYTIEEFVKTGKQGCVKCPPGTTSTECTQRITTCNLNSKFVFKDSSGWACSPCDGKTQVRNPKDNTTCIDIRSYTYCPPGTEADYDKFKVPGLYNATTNTTLCRECRIGIKNLNNNPEYYNESTYQCVSLNNCDGDSQVYNWHGLDHNWALPTCTECESKEKTDKAKQICVTETVCNGTQIIMQDGDSSSEHCKECALSEIKDESLNTCVDISKQCLGDFQIYAGGRCIECGTLTYPNVKTVAIKDMIVYKNSGFANYNNKNYFTYTHYSTTDANLGIRQCYNDCMAKNNNNNKGVVITTGDGFGNRIGNAPQSPGCSAVQVNISVDGSVDCFFKFPVTSSKITSVSDTVDVSFVQGGSGMVITVPRCEAHMYCQAGSQYRQVTSAGTLDASMCVPCSSGTFKSIATGGPNVVNTDENKCVEYTVQCNSSSYYNDHDGSTEKDAECDMCPPTAPQFAVVHKNSISVVNGPHRQKLTTDDDLADTYTCVDFKSACRGIVKDKVCIICEEGKTYNQHSSTCEKRSVSMECADGQTPSIHGCFSCAQNLNYHDGTCTNETVLSCPTGEGFHVETGLCEECVDSYSNAIEPFCNTDTKSCTQTHTAHIENGTCCTYALILNSSYDLCESVSTYVEDDGSHSKSKKLSTAVKVIIGVGASVVGLSLSYSVYSTILKRGVLARYRRV